MSTFQAGDLNLSIRTQAQDTLKYLDDIIERLNKIQGLFKNLKTDGISKKNGGGGGGGGGKKTSDTANKDKSYWEKTYSVDKFGKQHKTMQKDVKKTADSLHSVTQQFNKQGKVVKETTVDIDKYGNKTTVVMDKTKKKTSALGGMFRFASLYTMLNLMRRLGGAVASVVQAGADYSETLNLWQVAMRDNLDLADKFVNKMNKAYGISSKTLMNAQAIFKNMIGSLGQISDETAYKLSEALVQMSTDFSSLYNTSLESAMEKMQSMLAGQVRPIRSAGLDMTETTLYMFYQQLGGTKTMRQLNRTEKQLLSILAVYKQMGKAGALGDMSKTLNSFANQSRMMTEYWQELKTWSGLILKDLIEQAGILVKVNALLITAIEVIKAIAKSKGLGEENFIDGLYETAENTTDAIDELQGKLLDFDKFRTYNSSEQGETAVDEKVIEATAGYSSLLDGVTNQAMILAEQILALLGFSKDANGEFVTTEENLTKIEGAIKSVGTAIVVVLGLGVLAALTALGRGLYVYGITPLISLGKTIYAHAIAPLIQWVKNLIVGRNSMRLTTTAVTGLQMAVAALGVAFLAISFNKFVNTEMSGAKRLITILIAVAGAITAAAVAMQIFHLNWAGALTAAALVSGAAFSVSAAIPNFENGASDIDSGTVFRAGEFGKTEAVYTGSNGKTNVANIQQMKAAYSQALREWWSTAKHDVPSFSGVSDSGLYTIVNGEAKRRGKTFANV